MTHEEYMQKHKELNLWRINKRQEALRAVEDEYHRLIEPYRVERAKTMNKYNIQVGDVITDGETILRVELISYTHSDNEEQSYIEFKGVQLTRRWLEAKKQERTFIQQRYGKIPTVLRSADK